MSSNSSTSSILEPELYFLIVRFLSKGPCKKATKVLLEEVEEFKLLPQRFDWEGNEHFRSFENLCYLYRHIRSDHLLKIVERVGTLLDKELKPSVSGVKSLLGAGSLSLLRTAEGRKHTKWGVAQHIVRQHGAPLLPPSNLVPPSASLMVRAYQTSGVVRHHSIVPTGVFHKIGMYGRKLGHLSAVYCVLFDRTGRYIFTGADDGLVKIWSAYNMRLLATLRGHSAEITDMAVSFDNCHLASGSCDKVVRVWCLQTKAPAAVLQAHTALITSVQFCPKPHGNIRYLVSTGNDGCVCFWHWDITSNSFGPKPIKFVERSRAGAQMLCSSFSPGGVFLATGNSDHVVRVYFLHATGIDKICELEAHNDKVDSICYSGNLNRFVSGSNDGTARIWRYEKQEWRATVLNMKAKLESQIATDSTSSEVKDVRVTMISWTKDDSMVITAVSDLTIKVWNAYTGALLKILEGHEDEVFVLETCPTDARILLSAGHDGKIILWDIYSGTRIKKFFNLIEGQGHGAVFDCKFSPDGHTIAATDSHGHLLLMGFGSNEHCKKVPQQLFFHTDYRPLVRDANNYVLDEQTQQPPHLMPPPFLVDIDGNPYPPASQRLVPGREHCRESSLIPQMVVNADGESEVIGDRVGLQEVRDEPGGGLEEEDSETDNEDRAREHMQAAPSGSVAGSVARPSIDAMIERLQREQDNQLRHQQETGAGPSGSQNNNVVDHDYVIPTHPVLSPRANMQNRVGMRRSGEVEGVRQSLGNATVRSTKRERDALKRRVTVKPLDLVILQNDEDRRMAYADEELKTFLAERRKKQLSPQDMSTASVLVNKKRAQKQKGAGTRRYQDAEDMHENLETARNRLTTRALYDTEEEEEEAASDPWQSDNSSDDYSDWIGDQGSSNLEPPKRRSQRKRKRRRLSSSEEEMETIDVVEELELEEEEAIDASTTEDSSDDDEEEDGEERLSGQSPSPVKRESRKGTAQKKKLRKKKEPVIKRKRSARQRRPPLQPVDPNTISPGDIKPGPSNIGMELDERFRPPEWITTVIPRKAPFVPQMGDEVLYFRQGHERYLNAVLKKQVYLVEVDKNQPWHKIPNLRAHELVKIVGIKWLITPVRLCCLKLAFVDTVSGKLTGKSFTIKYHDMPDVIDFIVLKQHYDISVDRKWKKGNRFRSMIDDQWWLGTIKSQEPLEADFPDSLYQCFNVHWDNGEYEKLSPWDMEPIDSSRKPSYVGGGVDVTPEEYKSLLYVPKKTEWPSACGGREEDTQRLVEGLGALMQHAAAEPFIAPVDLQQFPSYAALIPYPMDLSTIKTRLENGFYRRITALQWDVRLLFSNASLFNESGSRIVSNANAVTETMLRFIKDVHCHDPIPILNSLTKEDLKTESSEDESQPGTSKREHNSSTSPDDGSGTSRKKRRKGHPKNMSRGSSAGDRERRDSYRSNPSSWHEQCESLLATLFECEDSEPFRLPVDSNIYRDYEDIVTNPMDLTTVHSKLATGNYNDPLDMRKDIRLIFQNSKLYNTNKRSRIFAMTLRLSALFEAQFQEVVSEWKSSLRLANSDRESSKRCSNRTQKREESPPPKPSLGWDILTNIVMDPNQPSTSGLSSQSAKLCSSSRSNGVNATTNLTIDTGASTSACLSKDSLSNSIPHSSLSKPGTSTALAESTGSKARKGTNVKNMSSGIATSSTKDTGSGAENGENKGEDSDATIVDGSQSEEGEDTEVCGEETAHNGFSHLQLSSNANEEDDEEEVREEDDDDEYKPSTKIAANRSKKKALVRGNKTSKVRRLPNSSSASRKKTIIANGDSNNSEEEDQQLEHKTRSGRMTNSRVPDPDEGSSDDFEKPITSRKSGRKNTSKSFAVKKSNQAVNLRKRSSRLISSSDGEDAPVHRKARAERRTSKVSQSSSKRPSRSAKQKKLYYDGDSDVWDDGKEDSNTDELEDKGSEEESEESSEEEESSEKASESSEDELITQSKQSAKNKKKSNSSILSQRAKRQISFEEESDKQEDSDSNGSPPVKKLRRLRSSSSPPKRKAGQPTHTVSTSGAPAKKKPAAKTKSGKNNNGPSDRETRNRGQQKITYLDDYYSEEDEDDSDDTTDGDSPKENSSSDEESARPVRSVSSRGRVRKLTARARAGLRVH